MTPKREQFVIEYTIDFNGTKAAIRAGFSVKGARQTASRLLANVDIQEAIKERILELSISKDEVLVRMGAMVRGEVATKIVDKIKTFDTLAATRDMGKVHAMFIDKQITTVEGMEFIEEEDNDLQ